MDRISENSRQIITVEEGQIRGGFGEAVGAYLMESGWNGRFRILGIPDRFVTHGNRDQLLAEVGLDAAGIAQSIGEFAGSNDKPAGFLHRLRFRRSGEDKKKVAGAGASEPLFTAKDR